MRRAKILLNSILTTAVVLSTSCRQIDNGSDSVLHVNNSISQARKYFKDPPQQYKSSPLWFWNTTLSKAQTRKIMVEAKGKGYYGLGILPSHGMSPEYMSPAFLEHYKYALTLADSLEMKICLYDEFYFPSGMAGGNLLKEYPEAVSKRLDKVEFIFKGPGNLKQKISQGEFMGAVAMELSSLQRMDISEKMKEGMLEASLPEGEWRIMIFLLNPDNSSGRNHVDYLDPLSVQRFIELTYERFYEAFPIHFGKTIDYAFYDEPCLRWVEGGRAWTGSYNNKFIDEYGFSPVMFYPALWYDIGPETGAARNLLFGFRAGLFASGFAGTINKWCRDHNIQLTGHVDQEEILNPVSICGDLIKSFKYQDIPCVDQIAHYGRASRIYKIISSAALNYGRPLVASETYGAISNMPAENLYKEAMDQFAKGINLMVPHAVWYGDKIDIPPDLSPESPVYGQYLDDYNQYIGRVQLLLQGGRHTADIALLYPIASLQAAYSFESGDPGLGGKIHAEADYLDVGEMLSTYLRTDYTIIHPETLDKECTIENASLKLENSTEFSNYQAIIIPGSKTIKFSNLQKIKDFYDNGGVVIATSVLPEFSAEFGLDNEVREVVNEIFSDNASNLIVLPRVNASSIWNTGGFLPAYTIDDDPGTSWRPSLGKPDDEWLEIEFGRDIEICLVEMEIGESLEYTFWKGWSAVEEDQSFSSRLVVKTGNIWIETGSFENKDGKMFVSFDPMNISGIRVIIDSGKTDKVAIPEISFFDRLGNNVDVFSGSYAFNINDKGGKSYFIPVITAGILRSVLDDGLKTWDISTPENGHLSNGYLTCIHKMMDGKDIYFFANSSDEEQELPLLLRGKMSLSRWDPHTGTIEKHPSESIRKDGFDLTRLRLSLGPVKSVFFISN